MISLTGISKKEFYLNAEQIEKIESVPDTLITLVNGKKYMVLESNKEVMDKFLEYKRRIFTLGK